MSTSEVIYQKQLLGAGMWSKVISRGKILRLTQKSATANVGMLLYNALEKHERYNMPDTLKGQHVFYLTEGRCLHSDMGRLIASVVRDTAGWHDTVCGASDAAWLEKKYGHKSFQEVRNDFYRDAQTCFLIELAKWGMGPRDIVPNINWFSKVVSNGEGELTYCEGAHPPGSIVELRMEMDTLIVLNTCQHPFDTAESYNPGEVLLEVLPAVEVDPSSDPCLQFRPENMRAYENNTVYHNLRF